MTVRVKTPLFSNSRSRVVKTLAEILPKSRFKSPKRRGSDLKYHRILGVQAPAKSFKLASKGQLWGAGPDLLALCRIMGPPPLKLSLKTMKISALTNQKPFSFRQEPTFF